MPFSFQQPWFLLVWFLIPAIWFMMRRSFFSTSVGTGGRASSRRSSILIGVLRSLLIFLLGFALADPRLPSPTDQVNLFYCLDVSESISPDKIGAAENFIQRSLTGRNENDQAGLIVFGKHPSLEISLRNDFELHSIQSDVNPNFTNIAEALQFAIGKLPQKGNNKIVLLSDGNENLHDALQTAHLAASLGVQVFPVPLASWFGDREVFIKALETPSTAPLETPYEIRIVIMSSHETQGELVLLKNDKLVKTQEVQLQPGKNVLTFADRLDESGLYLYKAVFNGPDDVFFQNNEGLSFTKGTEKSQILYLTGEDSASSPLVETLTLQGLQIVPKSLNELSSSLYNLLKYNAIILDNISGLSMSFMLMENIETYVRDMGGGLIMIGGDQSFGAGQYKNTSIEKALPVFMDAPTDLRFSALCLVFVIDKSSSMSTRYTNRSKLELAKIATFSSIELLNPTDSVGIVTFDSQFNWTVPIIQANQRQTIADKLTRVREAGGTDLFPALEDAFRRLKDVEASRKHVIVLSDGMTDDADFQSLVQSMAQAGISVSTVAIGTDSDEELMQSIAKWGQGRSYYTDNPDTIPRIFTGETKIVSKELISETTVQSSLLMLHEMLRGIEVDGLPLIYGQVITYPKPGASIVLNTVQGPLLAAWQYGLGRSVAFTSDLAARWGKEWLRWEHYGQFVSQMVKWAQRKDTLQEYIATIERTGEQGIFTVDVLDNQNRFINHLALNVNVHFPSEQSQTLSLKQIAPGRYQNIFPAEEIGAYYFSIFGAQTGETNRPEVFGFGIPYTDEFSKTGVNAHLLGQLAEITNGDIFPLEEIPETLFAVQNATREYGTAFWPSLILLFLFLLLVDVVIRKLMNMIYS